MSKKTEPDRTSAGEGARLNTGQVVDMGGEPVGDRRDTAHDLGEGRQGGAHTGNGV